MTTQTLTAPEALAIEVIGDVRVRTLGRLHAAQVAEWQVGETESGLPLVSGRLEDMGPSRVQEVLRDIAQQEPRCGRLLAVDDPARIGVTWRWPEGAQDGAAVAVVEIWAPALTGGAL